MTKAKRNPDFDYAGYAACARENALEQRRFPRASNAPRMARKCLCCSGHFMSEGSHNRLCGRCRLLPSD